MAQQKISFQSLHAAGVVFEARTALEAVKTEEALDKIIAFVDRESILFPPSLSLILGGTRNSNNDNI